VSAGFLPSRHGFAFTNTWPSQAAILLPAGSRRLGIGNAARGLCGGMVFAAADYWQAQVEPPSARPEAGTPLYQFIVRRLIDSWQLPAGVARYYQWMNLPDADVARRTIEGHWPQIAAQLDAGRPAALGVVTVATAWPGALGRNHQVLAFGYSTADSVVRIRVYDPNSGPSDDVHISLDTAAPGTAAFAHNLRIALPVRGFFLTSYAPAVPPAGG
jgi:hypothetical protein